MKRKLFEFGAMVALLAILSPAVPAATAGQPLNAPRIHIKDGTSTNWSGYAVETSLTRPQSGAVTDVKGTWTIPAVTVPAGSSNTAYSSNWVGIDGYSSNTVEQIGTDQDVIGGVPTYYAWYEMYPKYPVNLNTAAYPVTATDSIYAEVQYVANGFKLTIKDTPATSTTPRWTFSTTQKSGSAKRSAAEWVVEAPWSNGVLPLADFGTAYFTGASATLNGHSGPISDPAWQNDAITMVTSGGIVKAQPENISTTGTSSSFDVTWSHN